MMAWIATTLAAPLGQRLDEVGAFDAMVVQVNKATARRGPAMAQVSGMIVHYEEKGLVCAIGNPNAKGCGNTEDLVTAAATMRVSF